MRFHSFETVYPPARPVSNEPRRKVREKGSTCPAGMEGWWRSGIQGDLISPRSTSWRLRRVTSNFPVLGISFHFFFHHFHHGLHFQRAASWFTKHNILLLCFLSVSMCFVLILVIYPLLRSVQP